jgi:hypothetical protein
MRGLSLRKGLIEAAKADVVSLTAFEVGLFGWMALMYFVFFPAPHLRPDSPVYWFLMQIGMIAGFVTACPAGTWLIAPGSRRPCDGYRRRAGPAPARCRAPGVCQREDTAAHQGWRIRG